MIETYKGDTGLADAAFAIADAVHEYLSQEGEHSPVPIRGKLHPYGQFDEDIEAILKGNSFSLISETYETYRFGERLGVRKIKIYSSVPPAFAESLRVSKVTRIPQEPKMTDKKRSESRQEVFITLAAFTPDYYGERMIGYLLQAHPLRGISGNSSGN